jgi:UDP:flavonoid glycosyltransferase YjiC (YdhE family)
MALAPRTADEVTHAKHVVALGVGAVVALEELSAEALRQAVERLRVDEPTLVTARQLAERIAAAGAPDTAADRLEQLLTASPLTRAA